LKDLNAKQISGQGRIETNLTYIPLTEEKD